MLAMRPDRIAGSGSRGYIAAAIDQIQQQHLGRIAALEEGLRNVSRALEVGADARGMIDALIESISAEGKK